MKNVTKITVSALSVLMGLAGIEHGIGEILQGNHAPEGLLFPSWPGSAFFRIVGGEPAVSIIPNLLITGVLAILFSSIFMAWAVFLVQRNHGGWVLVLLSTLMLLGGGGIFPPVMGILLGILGTRINSPAVWLRIHLSLDWRHVLIRTWPWVFIVCLIAWLFLFPGINILSFFFGLNDPVFPIILILLALGSFLLTIISGFVFDMDSITVQRQ